MRTGILGWAGVIALAAAGRADGQGVERLRAAGVALARVPHQARELMAKETNAVLRESGVRVDWRWAALGSEVFREELLVVFLDSRGRGAHEGRMVLACSGLSGPAAAIWVYVPNVASALGQRGDVAPQSLGSLRELGTALGRVVAHEVVHAVAPDVPHDHGLMSMRFHLGQLSHERPRLDDRDARRFLSAAHSWRARGGPDRLRTPAVMAAGWAADPASR
jgi:hypothetical protein